MTTTDLWCTATYGLHTCDLPRDHDREEADRRVVPRHRCPHCGMVWTVPRDWVEDMSDYPERKVADDN